MDRRSFIVGSTAAAASLATRPAAAQDAYPSRAITVLPFLINVQKLPLITGAKQVPLRDISSLPVSNLTRKVARAALAAQLSFPPGAESNPFAPPPFRGALQVLR